MKHRSLAALTLFGLLLASAVSAQTINKCQAGKKKCVGQAVKRLLVCHAKAEAKGDPVDQSCLDKVREKFSHPSDNKGCIEKVEAKGGCSALNNAAILAAQIDAFVLDAVQNLDPGYPVAVLNKCSADKKKCVAKGAAKLLGCHAKADTKGELDPNCLIKRRQAFDGSLLVPPDAGKGCFEKVEAKETPEAICLTHDDTATLEAKIDAFVTDVVCVLTPAGDPQIDPQAFDACQPGCGGAHCVPTALLGSLPVSPATCTAAGGAAGACVPGSRHRGGRPVRPRYLCVDRGRRRAMPLDLPARCRRARRRAPSRRVRRRRAVYALLRSDCIRSDRAHRCLRVCLRRTDGPAGRTELSLERAAGIQPDRLRRMRLRWCPLRSGRDSAESPGIAGELHRRRRRRRRMCSGCHHRGRGPGRPRYLHIDRGR